MKAAPVLLLLALLGGCDDMTEQPKTKTYSQPPAVPPEGTVSTQPSAVPPPVSAALLTRGREEYRVYCAPCHAERGDGHGMIVQRGFPLPPSFQSAALLRRSPDELYRTISDGSGVMYGFAARILPADRWAIVAYIKALQVSRNTPVSALSPEERSRLP